MLRTITLQIPEATFTAIEKQAETAGKQPTELAGELLAQAVNHSKVEPDPLDALIGSIDSPVTDVAERHDYYIGQAVLKELRGESDSD
ncbi:MAG: hypothetical protein HY327_12085 [Chloroflexi bacterium]|nr:hypothetical protein [Chloroflexota bacterium]